MRPSVCQRVRVLCSCLSLPPEVRPLCIKVLRPASPNMLPVWPKLAPQWNECAQPVVAQVNPSPDDRADINRKQHFAKKRISGGQLDRNRAAEIPGQQDRAKDRSTRKHVQENAHEFDDPERNGEAYGKAKLRKSFHNRRQLHQMDHCVEEQKSHDETPRDAPSPK